ncbi:hypothetical protein, partial [Mesorhizobium sp. M7A.F.Ca.CA.004.11.2.1]|uniref:hypothetical protein n=1 Tax=Mesorhizobium sp. M7A.F.Ca.CA.004.11.2.1 TaxID=2496699 RepID=UPI001FE13A92
PFNTRETVALDTPARMETSNMVIINGLPLSTSAVANNAQSSIGLALGCAAFYRSDCVVVKRS